MITVSILSCSEPSEEQLNGLKVYASVPTEKEDALLKQCLKQAFCAVQEKADASLLPCVLRVEDTEIENGYIRLYQDVAEILTTIIDEKETQGRLQGRMLYVSGSYGVVTYRAEPIQGNLDRLLPVVYQYATALYDGQIGAPLKDILEQC